MCGSTNDGGTSDVPEREQRNRALEIANRRSDAGLNGTPSAAEFAEANATDTVGDAVDPEVGTEQVLRNPGHELYGLEPGAFNSLGLSIIGDRSRADRETARRAHRARRTDLSI